MFHFWFNTFFIADEEPATLDCETDGCGEAAGPTSNSTSRMNVSRTTSDQTRVVDRIAAEQRRLHKQLNNELLNRTRRVDSSDHLHVCKSNSSPAGLSRPQSDSRLARPQSPAARFYDVPPDAVPQMAQPSRRTYRVLRLRKKDIDRANKDSQHRLYPADFAVSCAGRRLHLRLIIRLKRSRALGELWKYSIGQKTVSRVKLKNPPKVNQSGCNLKHCE